MNRLGFPRPDQLPTEPGRLRVAVLLSGGGTTMANLADRISAGRLNAGIEIVVSSRDRVAGLDRARDRNLPIVVLSRQAFVRDRIFDHEGYTDGLLHILDPIGIDLVVLAGFMSRLGPAIFSRYPVINVHPALLPRFGGKGMYGHHVHESVLASGEAESGCTVHFVDPEYDHGPIIAQRSVPVLPEDTPDSLAARVQEAERELYPEVIGWIAAGRIRVEGGDVVLLPGAGG